MKITGPSLITTFAGTGVEGATDGPATSATFSYPRAIARDSAGNIYVSDENGKRIRKIGTDNLVTTLTGMDTGSWSDGPLATAGFTNGSAMCIDRIGNLYVVENSPSTVYSDRIRKIRPDGTVTSLYGPTLDPGTGAVSSTSSFGLPRIAGIDVGPDGVVYASGIVERYGSGNGDVVIKAVQEDWDNDGIPDSEETALGPPFIVGVDDRAVDSDGDEISNSAEWVARTNALSTSSRPGGAAISRQPSGTLALQFPCDPAKQHQLEYSDGLRDWLPMGSPFTVPHKSFITTFPTPEGGHQRFYRLKSTP